MNYQSPKDIWEVNAKLDYNEPLEFDDLRYVPTEEGRGNFSFDRLLRILNIDPKQDKLMITPKSQYIFFCGHMGCGKGTELRILTQSLDKKELYFVIFMDADIELDRNNLQYSDVLMALAHKLFKKLEDEEITIDQIYIDNIASWFKEKILKHDKIEKYSMDITAGAEIKGEIPFLTKLFGRITSSFQTNSTYKEELRQIIKNTYSQFASAFNQFILAVEEKLKEDGRTGKLLFIIDGTEKLRGEDRERFFIDDFNQLQLIKSNFIYCAPIDLISDSYKSTQYFKIFVLPMIKVQVKCKGGKFGKGYEVLREMIYKRVDKSLFTSKKVVDEIIEYSGGHPREMLKLLHYAYLNSESGKFDKDAVSKAINDLATDFRRILEPGDYKILYDNDNSKSTEMNSERVKFLLRNLALLEYNNNKYWRCSHPVIRKLEGYVKQQRLTKK